MERWFRIFLVCVLGFCVVMGAICILWPLTHPEEIITSLPQETEGAQGNGPSAPTGPVEPEPEPAAPAEQEPVEPEPEPEPEPAEPAEPAPEEKRAQAALRDMTREEQVYQLFIVTPEALTGVDTATAAGDMTREALAKRPVGGLVYFSKNLENRAQTIEMLSKTASYCDIPPLLAVDEEGGTVSRVGVNPDMGVNAFDDMAEYGEAGDAETVRGIGQTMGAQLRELGFNVNLAPVADVLTNPRNRSIGRRSFSSDPAVAAEMVRAMVEGMEESGCISALKHFPGQGDVSGDTHKGLAVSERTLEEMESCEFQPFEAGIAAGAPMVMVGHLSVPALTGGEDTPASLSPEVITGTLRERLGFRGVVITDALDMDAVTERYDAAEAAVAALEAGADLLLMPDDLDGAVEGVLEALDDGTLSEERIGESVVRILAMKYAYLEEENAAAQ